MPRACFLLDHFWGERSGGAEWQTFVLCRAMREANWEVHYIAESLTGKTGTTCEAHGIVVHWLAPLQWRSRIHPSQHRIDGEVRTILNEIQPDLIYSRGHNCFTGMGVCHRYKRLRPTKTIWGVAADWEIDPHFFTARVARYYRKALWKKALQWLDSCVKNRDYAGEIRNADCIVVQTDTQRQLVEERFQKDSVLLRSSQEIPSESIAKASPPVAIFVAHIGPRKRVELFVELARRCQDLAASFVVVGDFSDPGYEKEVRGRASGLSSVRFSGPVSMEEANRRIGEASLLVSTTDPGREGYPNVFIQAWMRNTPVASLAHDPDGVIAENGFLGIYAGDMDNLVSKVRRMFADPSRLHQMGHLAREWAIQRHGCEANRARIVEVFSEVANRRHL